MAKTTAQILTSLYTARDNLLDALATNAGVHELEIRGRRVVRKDFHSELMSVERLISYYENQASGKPLGPVRTVARIKHRS